MQQAGTPPPNVTQTIVNGTLGSPAVFSVLLILCALLMGWSIAKLGNVQEELQRTNRELRLLQNDERDLSDIMLRKGYISPTEIENPKLAEPTQRNQK